MNLNMDDEKIGVKNEQGEAKEQMISLLSAASAITADTTGSSEKSIHLTTSADPLKAESLVGKSMASELDEDVPMTFPQRLMEILSNEEHSDIISWLPHGKGFIIYKKKKFASDVLPLYFKQSKFTSFTRKLNRWGFTRVTRGPETGAYYHKFFQRGELRLCMQMSCQSVKPQPSNSIPPYALGGLGVAAAAAAAKNPLLGGVFPGNNPADLAQQNQNLIRHQLQQLQMQQLQLQQLQIQQQQQLQAAELFRKAIQTGDNVNEENNAHSLNHSNNPPNADGYLGMKNDANSFFLQTLQRTKESGTGLMGSQPIALLPSLPSAHQQQPPNNSVTDAVGNGKGAWAA